VVKIHAVGLRAFATRFHALPRVLSINLGKRMRGFAVDPIMKQSLRICPKKTGALRSTWKVRRTKTTPDHIRIQLSYGGRTPGSSEHFVQGAKIKPMVDYAHVLHENLYKTYSEPGTGPKYLEQPINNNLGELKKLIRASVRESVLSVFSKIAPAKSKPNLSVLE